MPRAKGSELSACRRPRRAPAQAPAAEEAKIILKGQGGENRANRPRLECAKPQVLRNEANLNRD